MLIAELGWYREKESLRPNGGREALFVLDEFLITRRKYIC